MEKDIATPERMPSTFCARHDEFPELKDAQLGETVEIKVRGKVVGLRAADRYSKGETTLEINSGNLSEVEAEPEDDVENMSSEEMRKRLPVKDEEEE
jgi:hypothetical protein